MAATVAVRMRVVCGPLARTNVLFSEFLYGVKHFW